MFQINNINVGLYTYCIRQNKNESSNVNTTGGQDFRHCGKMRKQKSCSSYYFANYIIDPFY